MRDLLEEFNLDPEIAVADRQAVLYSAEVYQLEADRLAGKLDTLHLDVADGADSEITSAPPQRIRQCLIIAGTAFRRAGAHSILLDDWEAAPIHFANAGRAYEAAGLPYASMMNYLALIKTNETSQFERYTRSRRLNDLENSDILQRTEPWFKRQMVYPMLIDAAQHLEVTDRRLFRLIRHELDQDRWKRTGVLGIPISIYLDLLSVISSDDRVPVDILRPLLDVYENATRQAMSDRYHWRRFGTRYHPVEPDIVSIIVALREYFRLQQRSLEVEIVELRMHPFCREAILGILRNYPEESSGWFSPAPFARA